MAKFRKKPVVIEAIRFTSDIKPVDLHAFLGSFDGVHVQRMGPGESLILIDTLEGVMKANEGDWIIKGVKGEFYQCKPDIFEATYERVND